MQASGIILKASRDHIVLTTRFARSSAFGLISWAIRFARIKSSLRSILGLRPRARTVPFLNTKLSLSKVLEFILNASGVYFESFWGSYCKLLGIILKASGDHIVNISLRSKLGLRPHLSRPSASKSVYSILYTIYHTLLLAT